MRHRPIWILIIFAVGCPGAQEQWLDHPAPGVPRTRDGKVNLSAAAPRASDGKPDLSGVWQTNGSTPDASLSLQPNNTVAEDSPSRYFLNILADFKPGEEPVRPEAAARFPHGIEASGKASPLTHCLPAGLPLLDVYATPHKIIQMPGLVAILYETDTTFRQIFTDGRKPPEDPLPTWQGYSTGKWEGDTLVVDVVGFNDRTWLDARGHGHSDALHITERFHRLDFGHMELAITISDPKTYTKPFTVNVNQTLHPNTDLIEFVCAENEKDAEHMLGK
jgi:hypothetical protein